MTPAHLVELLTQAVDDIVVSEVEFLRDPPGRPPYPTQIQRGEWYAAASERDREVASQLIRVGAFAAIFDVLALLDGVSGLWDDEGTLQLDYISADGDTKSQLNDPEVLELHAEFRGDGPVP